VQCNQKTQPEKPSLTSVTEDSADLEPSTPAKVETKVETSEEPCPICREKFSDRKMIFQCGHFLCCKCEILHAIFFLSFYEILFSDLIALHWFT
jgi:Zinc finger, C3HC4 type (RING finger)